MAKIGPKWTFLTPPLLQDLNIGPIKHQIARRLHAKLTKKAKNYIKLKWGKAFFDKEEISYFANLSGGGRQGRFIKKPTLSDRFFR
jgi:hypothetical protein